jgi:hypothetical protein
VSAEFLGQLTEVVAAESAAQAHQVEAWQTPPSRPSNTSPAGIKGSGILAVGAASSHLEEPSGLPTDSQSHVDTLWGLAVPNSQPEVASIRQATPLPILNDSLTLLSFLLMKHGANRNLKRWFPLPILVRALKLAAKLACVQLSVIGFFRALSDVSIVANAECIRAMCTALISCDSSDGSLHHMRSVGHNSNSSLQLASVLANALFELSGHKKTVSRLSDGHVCDMFLLAPVQFVSNRPTLLPLLSAIANIMKADRAHAKLMLEKDGAFFISCVLRENMLDAGIVTACLACVDLIPVDTQWTDLARTAELVRSFVSMLHSQLRDPAMIKAALQSMHSLLSHHVDLRSIVIAEQGVQAVSSVSAAHVGAETTAVITEITELAVKLLLILLKHAAANNLPKEEESWQIALAAVLRALEVSVHNPFRSWVSAGLEACRLACHEGTVKVWEERGLRCLVRLLEEFWSVDDCGLAAACLLSQVCAWPICRSSAIVQDVPKRLKATLSAIQDGPSSTVTSPTTHKAGKFFPKILQHKKHRSLQQVISKLCNELSMDQQTASAARLSVP